MSRYCSLALPPCHYLNGRRVSGAKRPWFQLAGQPWVLGACQPEANLGLSRWLSLASEQEAPSPGLQPRVRGKGLLYASDCPHDYSGTKGDSHCLLPPASTQLFWPCSPISPACLWKHWAFVSSRVTLCAQCSLGLWLQAVSGGPIEPQAPFQVSQTMTQ